MIKQPISIACSHVPLSARIGSSACSGGATLHFSTEYALAADEVDVVGSIRLRLHGHHGGG